MHLGIIISSLRCGGAEKIASWLANQFVQSDLSVTVFTYSSSEAPFYDLDGRVHVRPLGVLCATHGFEKFTKNFQRLKVIRDAVNNASVDCVISFMPEVNVQVLISLLWSGIPVIATEHTDPSKHVIPRLYSLLRRYMYPRAAAVTVLTDHAREEMPYCFEKIRVMPNAVFLDNGAPVAADKSKTILAVGRLSSEKGFADLIDAFSFVSGEFPDWSLVVYGEGKERSKLESLIQRHELQGRVALPGVKKELASVYAAASCFVLPSYYEGFGLALAEAQMSGLPAIGFSDVEGVRELVVDGRNGIWVDPAERVVNLAAALRVMLDNPQLRQRLGEQARKDARRYAPERVFPLWMNLVHQCVSSSD